MFKNSKPAPLRQKILATPLKGNALDFVIIGGTTVQNTEIDIRLFVFGKKLVVALIGTQIKVYNDRASEQDLILRLKIVNFCTYSVYRQQSDCGRL